MISLVPLTLIASWISMCNKDVYDQLAWTSKYIHSRFLYLWYSAHLSTYQSTLQLLLCCHLFDYTWSVALTLQSYLQQLGRLIAVIVDVAGQGQSQLRPLHVLNLTPSWGHPIQGYNFICQDTFTGQWPVGGKYFNMRKSCCHKCVCNIEVPIQSKSTQLLRHCNP